MGPLGSTPRSQKEGVSMDRDLLGGIVIVVGAALVVLSVLADPIGIGSSDGFGWQQTLGVVVGALAIVIGLIVVTFRGDLHRVRRLQLHH